ncbi:MAG: phage integrase SAM-like domain-containing protein [Tannerella sp.]|jgi:hypothetical protein|nr:phage integrase SAM-like domain-containing protein [Tannerella sp.]
MAEGTGGIYITMVNAVQRYIKRDALDISEINAEFLRNFENFLKSEPSKKRQ